MSIVELMVGITVGLIVAAAASMVAVNQINEHRRLMLETQVQQDLRTAADLLQQELRRAGFRGQAEDGVWAPAKAVGSLKEEAPQLASSSPYATFTISSGDAGTTATYLYARKDPATSKYNVSGTPWNNEHFGVRLNNSNHVLYIQLGVDEHNQPNWQPITDPQAVSIETFTIESTERNISLGDFCETSCGHVGEQACPTQQIREVKFKIVGKASHDVNVVRTLTGVERIRADVIDGVCPP